MSTEKYEHDTSQSVNGLFVVDYTNSSTIPLQPVVTISNLSIYIKQTSVGGMPDPLLALQNQAHVSLSNVVVKSDEGRRLDREGREGGCIDERVISQSNRRDLSVRVDDERRRRG